MSSCKATNAKTFEQVAAERVAKVIRENADPAIGWREAGYGSAEQAARVLVSGAGETDPEIVDLAVEIVAATLRE